MVNRHPLSNHDTNKEQEVAPSLEILQLSGYHLHKSGAAQISLHVQGAYRQQSYTEHETPTPLY